MAAPRRRRGIALIWTALLVVVLLGFVGLACDSAYVDLAEQQLQTVADASALAAADGLRTSTSYAQQQALTVATLNHVAGQPMALASSDVVFGQYTTSGSSPGFVGGAQPYNAVRVTARRTAGSPLGSLPLLFGPIFGVASSEVSRSAVAMIPTGSASVITLDPTYGALSITGGSVLNVAGDIHVNSVSSTAVTMSGNGAAISADSLEIAGNYYVSGNGTLPANTQTNANPAPDPYVTLASPAQPAPGVKSGTTLTPGYYASGIHITGSGSYLFQPGVYYIDNGFSVTSSSTLSITAHGVFLYINTGTFQLTGSGAVDITPPSSGTYTGISIFQSRTNTSTPTIGGSGSLSVQGAIYVPAAPLTLTGNGAAYGTQIVVQSLSITGTGASINVPAGSSGTTPTGPAFLVQ